MSFYVVSQRKGERDTITTIWEERETKNQGNSERQHRNSRRNTNMSPSSTSQNSNTPHGIYKDSDPNWPMHPSSPAVVLITKTCLYNFDPLQPNFYIVKLGFTGVYIIFLISAQNIDCGYSLELPRWGGSNEYPQSMFWAEIWKISDFFIGKFSFFWWENFQYI